MSEPRVRFYALDYPGDTHLTSLQQLLGIHVPVADPSRAIPTREDIITFMQTSHCFMAFLQEKDRERLIGIAYITPIVDQVPGHNNLKLIFHIGLIAVELDDHVRRYEITVRLCREIINHYTRECRTLHDEVVIRLNVARQWTRRLADELGFEPTRCATFRKLSIATAAHPDHASAA